jgi:hypothetical protein
MKALYRGTAQISADGLYRYELTREDLMGTVPGLLARMVASPVISAALSMGADKRSVVGGRPLVDIGLNPSTATAEKDDRTIRKGCLYAQMWGCSRFLKYNAYAYRTKDPAEMFAAKRAGVDIVGPENLQAIRRGVALARELNGIILVSWGGNIETAWQCELAEEFGDDARCVKVNGDGTPMHYLYAKNNVQLVPWRCPSLASTARSSRPI